MRIYVESNFLLELVLSQEEAGACSQLLQAAESKVIRLVAPAYALVESWETVERRKTRWKTLREEHSSQLNELNRSSLTKSAGAKLGDAGLDFLKAEQALADSRELLWSRVGEHVELIPVDGQIISRAVVNKFALKFPDAIILASVLTHLERHPQASLFLNRNINDFLDPAILEELALLKCKYFGSFGGGVAYMKHRLGITI